MTFKKLALAAAIAAVPAVGFSVETLEDTDLGVVTGRDGIEVNVAIGASGIQTDLYVHDKDGLNTGSHPGYSFDGAIVISGMQVGVGGAAININIDAGDNSITASAPILNVNIALPSALTIATGNIYVANSGIDEGNRGVSGQVGPILNNMTIIVGSTQLNVQLGNEQQAGSIAGTDMIVVNATITGGITMSNFRLNDSNSGGGIGMTSMTMKDAGGADLTVAADINATAAGLVIGLGQFGHATNGMSVEIVDQYLGSTSAGIIGDISVVGLNLNGTTVTVSGK